MYLNDKAAAKVEQFLKEDTDDLVQEVRELLHKAVIRAFSPHHDTKRQTA